MSSSLSNQADYITLADKGMIAGKIITGTGAVTPPTGHYFFKIVPVSTTIVVAAQGDVTDATNPDLTDLTSIPSGVPIYGKFNSITLTSGEAIGYCVKG